MMILLISHFAVMKLVFFVQILIILTLIVLFMGKMILILLFLSDIKFEKGKALKKKITAKLMPTAWHPFLFQKLKKQKEIDPIFIEEL